jgi:hypothetical protein
MMPLVTLLEVEVKVRYLRDRAKTSCHYQRCRLYQHDDHQYSQSEDHGHPSS